MYLQKDLGTGKEQHITITAGSKHVPNSEIDKAVKEAAEFEAQDKKRKEQSTQETMQTPWYSRPRKQIEEVGDKLDANDENSSRS